VLQAELDETRDIIKDNVNNIIARGEWGAANQ